MDAAAGTRFVRLLTCRPPRAGTCADLLFCFVFAATVHVSFSTCYVPAARDCRADHCEAGETILSSSCVACGNYSTCQLRNVVAWRRLVLPCRSLRSGGGRIGRPGHQHSDPDEARHAGREDGQDAIYSSNLFMWTACLVPDMPLADVEPVPRRSRKGFCRLIVDYGNGGHCAKLDKQITVAHAVLAQFGCTVRRC